MTDFIGCYCAADCLSSEASLVLYSAPYGHNIALMSGYIKGLFSYVPILTSVIISSFHITGGEEINLWLVMVDYFTSIPLLEVKIIPQWGTWYIQKLKKKKQNNCICFKRIVWHFRKHACLFAFWLGVRRSISHSWMSPWSYSRQLQVKHQPGSVQR